MADSLNKKNPQASVAPPFDAIAISYGGGDQSWEGECRGFYISTAGNLNVVMASGRTVLFSNLVAGQDYPREIVKVLQASSTAAGVLLF